jgi:hypothetical protein
MMERQRGVGLVRLDLREIHEIKRVKLKMHDDKLYWLQLLGRSVGLLEQEASTDGGSTVQ